MPSLRNDFRFTLMVVFGSLTVIAVTPFAVFRFANQQPLAGAVDVAIQLCIASIVLYAWRSRNMDRAGMLVAISNSAGCVAMGYLAGMPGVLWMYPVLLANFLLATRRTAVLISAVAIGVLAASNAELASTLDRAMFVVTAFVVSLFAYIFSQRTDAQREELETLATQDPLTGAINRRGMDKELQSAVETRARDRSSYGLAVLDLDHFKDVNDLHGHEAGDAVLVQLAELVRESTRRGDRFYRFGGEEFALLLPGVGAETLGRICEALRDQVHAEIGCHGKPITVSIGATLLQSGESAAEWLQRADSAMYRAKREGRDRVVVELAAEPSDGNAARRSRTTR